MFVQAAGRQTEGDHDHTDDPGGRAAEHLSGKPDRQCRQQAHRQDHGQTGRQTGQCHAWPVGTAAEDTFHDGGQGPHAADGMDAGRGFPQQTVQQQGGGQEKEGGQCAHRHAPDAPVAAAGEIGESVASAAAAREGLQPDSGCFRGWGRKEMPFSPCRRAGTGQNVGREGWGAVLRMWVPCVFPALAGPPVCEKSAACARGGQVPSALVRRHPARPAYLPQRRHPPDGADPVMVHGRTPPVPACGAVPRTAAISSAVRRAASVAFPLPAGGATVSGSL